MKLAEHVDHLRELIEAAFDKQFARLGFSKTKQMDAEQVQRLPEEVQSKRQRFVAMLDNHIGETGSYASAREKLLDELTFTLFNRLAAIKVMEAASLFPPILTKQKEQGDRSFGHKAWLEEHPQMRTAELEGIRDYLKAAFDELGSSLPLYSKNYPYAMLPDAISLNDIIDAFNGLEQDEQIIKSYEAGIWCSDDVLGWMYESYNNKKKQAHKDSKAKVEYDKVALQSQVYTPRWVVQFLVENSLGKMYLEMYPHSEIKKRYKIANAPKTQTRKPKPLHEIKTIDPACGSGNFLMYAFDFYFALYQDQIDNYGADYDEKDIPKLIIENNLHGIDLDDRAVQLAQLGLFIKVKKTRLTFGELNFKIVSSDFYLPEFHEVQHIFEHGDCVSDDQKMFIEKVWGDLRYAYKFGSLIHLDKEMKEQLSQVKEIALGETFYATTKLKKKIVEGDLFAAADYAEHKAFAENFFVNLFAAVEQYACTSSNKFLTCKTRDAITFLEILTTEYDLAAANPPYTDSGDFGPDLKNFVDNNFKNPYKFNSNLYSVFLKRCYEITNEDGMLAMIHPRTFMFIKSFEDVRRFIVEKMNINVFVDYSLSSLFGSVMVDPAFYVLQKKRDDGNAWFVSLDQYTRTSNEKFKKNFLLQALDDFINNVQNSHNYVIPIESLKIIKSWPFIFWISNSFREKFKGGLLFEQAVAVEGFKSNNNNKILRFHWELIEPNKLRPDIRYFTKGGSYNKWYGNNWMAIKWERDGGNQVDNGASLSAKDYYFAEGLTYTKASIKGNSFRWLEKEQIFDSSAPGLFSKRPGMELTYLIGLMNSKLIKYLINCFNPTAASQVGDIHRLPFSQPSSFTSNKVSCLAKNNVEIKKHLCSFEITEMNFKNTPMTAENVKGDFFVTLKNFMCDENHLLTQVLINECLIDDYVFDVYGTTESDRAIVLAKEGNNVCVLPIIKEAKNSFLSDANLKIIIQDDEVRSFVDSLPEIEFPAEHVEAFEKEFVNLYQKNNSFDDFCIRHQVNPINVWYWFKQSKVIPQNSDNNCDTLIEV